jgi:hypothetical protein
MPDGFFYRVAVADDGSRVSLTPVAGPTGRLKLACAPAAMLLMGPEGYLWARSEQPELALPAAGYGVFYAFLGQRDSAGKLWTAAYTFRQPRRVRIKGDGTVELEAGPPLKMTVEADSNSYRGGNSFSASLTDRWGNDVEIRRPDGQQVAPPKLRISTPAGKGVKEMAFGYG